MIFACLDHCPMDIPSNGTISRLKRENLLIVIVIVVQVALCDMATVDKTIPDHFRGILCRGVKNYTVEEEIAAKDTLFEGREKEQLLPGEVLIRVTRCGICAGDAKVSREIAK